MIDILTTIIRHSLTYIGGGVGLQGFATDNNVHIVLSFLTLIISPVWSLIEKKYFTKK